MPKEDQDPGEPGPPPILTPAVRLTLARVLEALPDGVVAVRSGHIRWVNTKLARLLGYADPASLVDLEPERFVHPGSRATLATQLAVVRRGRPSRSEVMLRRSDGTSLPVELHAVPLELGGPLLFALVRDLTERRELMAKALEHDRLTALGTLAGGLAHELNNPLAFLLANLAFLADELDVLGVEGHLASVSEAKVAELTAAVTEARSGARRVARTVADLEAFAQAPARPSEMVDLREVLDVCLELAGNEIRHRAHLTRLVPEDPVLVAGDRGRLGQVVLPILVNAAQAIPEGEAADREIAVRLEEDGTRATLSVRDTGEGMTEAVRQHLFDPFFTTRPLGGQGLGLSVAHGIVSALGGSLAVESLPGAGTTVTVRLPSRGPALDRPPAPEAPPTPASRAGRILVVDDEALVGLAIRRTLGPEHEVVVAQRTGEALSRLAGGEVFDVVLCDLMMPDATGMDLWEAVSPEVRRRILFLTGGAFTDRAAAFLDRVQPPMMTKPFDPEALRAEVARRLAEDDPPADP